MKKIHTFIAALVLMTIGTFALLPAATVGASVDKPLDAVCADVAASNGGADSGVCANKDQSTDGFVGTLVNTLLFAVGALSVVMIIVGGILYVTSAGNSSSVSKAKNTILYAVVGLIVSFFAYAIVNWVFQLF